MSIPMLSGAAAETFNASAGHSGAAPYVLAFMSSTAIEVVAVAAILSMVAFSLGRSILGTTSLGDHWLRLWSGFDVLKLTKIIIPLACLTVTVWVWIATQGA